MPDFLCLLPPVLAIVLAFRTRNVLFSLFLGAWSGELLLWARDGHAGLTVLLLPFINTIARMIRSLGDPWAAGIILQILLIAALIMLISKMGGTRAVAEALARRAKGRISAQLATWLLGLVIFFDDYANALIIGPVMRPIFDRFRISRAKLSYLIDSTAAPVAGIALISTWIATEVACIHSGLIQIGQEKTDAYGLFVASLPFRFYSILLLAFIPCQILLGREIGPMLAAERQSLVPAAPAPGTAVPAALPETDELTPEPGCPRRSINAILPLLVLVGGALGGFYFDGLSRLDEPTRRQILAAPLSLTSLTTILGATKTYIVMSQAAGAACATAILLAVGQKLFSLGRAFEHLVGGMKSVMLPILILLLAWTLSGTLKDLHTADYLATQLTSHQFPALLLPAAIFLLGSAISFATGTSYGTMLILMPLAIPAVHAIAPGSQPLLLAAIAAVLTGATFGDHCSPISDTTILSAMGAGVDLMTHVRTQLPYALLVGTVSLLAGYLFSGAGISPWTSILAGLVILVVVLRLFGKPVEKPGPPAA
jgi:Na+/H+ antiporter NhaC